MKKGIVIIGVLAVLVLASFGASALLPTETSQFTRLFQKDPSTWEVVPSGAFGYFSIQGITMKPVRNVNPPCIAIDDVSIDQPEIMTWLLSVRASGLEPLTEYAVVNYHEAWPWADTLATFTTDYNGYGYVFDETDGLVHDKVWVVPTSDFNVDLGKFTAWHPTEYLFEETVFD